MTKFEVGSTVHCIYSAGVDGLITQGSYYEVLEGGCSIYTRVLNKFGTEGSYCSTRFEEAPTARAQVRKITKKAKTSSPVHSFSPGGAPKTTALQTQIGGAHYTDLAIQPIEYIQANRIPFPEGNVIKYVTRWRSKGGIKDLQKAKHHLELLIEFEEAAFEHTKSLLARAGR